MTTSVAKSKGRKLQVKIYHNPRCGTSRKVLAAIRDAGIEPEVVEYLKTPPSKSELKSLLRDLKMQPRDLVRSGQKEYKAARLDDAKLATDEIIDAMLAHPVLINRPIVVSAKGTRLCRPADRVRDLLP